MTEEYKIKMKKRYNEAMKAAQNPAAFREVLRCYECHCWINWDKAGDGISVPSDHQFDKARHKEIEGWRIESRGPRLDDVIDGMYKLLARGHEWTIVKEYVWDRLSFSVDDGWFIGP